MGFWLIPKTWEQGYKMGPFSISSKVNFVKTPELTFIWLLKKEVVVKSWSRSLSKLSFLNLQIANPNVRSWFLFKLPLLDHITTEHGRLKIRDYLPLQDPDIALFIRMTSLSLWTLFKLNYIPKKSSFSPKGETADFVFPGLHSYSLDFYRIPEILRIFKIVIVFPRFSSYS